MFSLSRRHNLLAICLLTAFRLTVSLPQELGRFLTLYFESGLELCQFLELINEYCLY